jgi:hypothetical protein
MAPETIFASNNDTGILRPLGPVAAGVRGTLVAGP